MHMQCAKSTVQVHLGYISMPILLVKPTEDSNAQTMPIATGHFKTKTPMSTQMGARKFATYTYWV